MAKAYLIKKNPLTGVYERIYPYTYTSAVTDEDNGENLVITLGKYNSITLPYYQSKAQTRLLVPAKYRNVGTKLTYLVNGETYPMTEKYLGASFDDLYWSDDSLWELEELTNLLNYYTKYLVDELLKEKLGASALPYNITYLSSSSTSDQIREAVNGEDNFKKVVSTVRQGSILTIYYEDDINGPTLVPFWVLSVASTSNLTYSVLLGFIEFQTLRYTAFGILYIETTDTFVYLLMFTYTLLEEARLTLDTGLDTYQIMHLKGVTDALNALETEVKTDIALSDEVMTWGNAGLKANISVTVNGNDVKILGKIDPSTGDPFVIADFNVLQLQLILDVYVEDGILYITFIVDGDPGTETVEIDLSDFIDVYFGSTYIDVGEDNIISLNYSVLHDLLLDDGFLRNAEANIILQNYVTLAGTQTISGPKTFTGVNNFNGRTNLAGRVGTDLLPFGNGAQALGSDTYRWQRLNTQSIDNTGNSVLANTYPQANNTYDLGTSSAAWNNIYTNNLTIRGILSVNNLLPSSSPSSVGTFSNPYITGYFTSLLGSNINGTTVLRTNTKTVSAITPANNTAGFYADAYGSIWLMGNSTNGPNPTITFLNVTSPTTTNSTALSFDNSRGLALTGGLARLFINTSTVNTTSLLYVNGDTTISGTINGAQITSSGNGSNYLTDDGNYKAVDLSTLVPKSTTIWGRPLTDNVTGNLSSVGNIAFSSTGYSIGTTTLPASTIYTNNLVLPSTSASVRPNATGAGSLGAASFRWNNLYVNNGYLRNSTTEYAAFGDADPISGTAINCGGNLVASGNILPKTNNEGFLGDTNFRWGNLNVDYGNINRLAPISVVNSLIPDVLTTRNLGTNNLRWNILYTGLINASSAVNIGTSGSLTVMGTTTLVDTFPYQTNTHTLGDASLRWADLWTYKINGVDTSTFVQASLIASLVDSDTFNNTVNNLVSTTALSNTLSNYAKHTDVDTKVAPLATTLSVDTKLLNYSLTGHTHTLYDTITSVDDKLSNYSKLDHSHSLYETTTSINSKLANYETCDNVDSKINAHHHDTVYQPIGSYSLSSHTHNNYVPTTRTINGKALSANIELALTDIGAAASGHNHSGVYLPVGDYALSSHLHTGVYLPAGSYATSNHTHDYSSVYQAKGDYATSSHTHTANLITNLPNQFTVYSSLGASGNDNDGKYYVTANPYGMTLAYSASSPKTFLYKDGSRFYITVSDVGGTTFNSLRPFDIDLKTGEIRSQLGLLFKGGTVTDTLTADKIVKSGGAASLILMADGSVKELTSITDTSLQGEVDTLKQKIETLESLINNLTQTQGNMEVTYKIIHPGTGNTLVINGYTRWHIGVGDGLCNLNVYVPVNIDPSNNNNTYTMTIDPVANGIPLPKVAGGEKSHIGTSARVHLQSSAGTCVGYLAWNNNNTLSLAVNMRDYVLSGITGIIRLTLTYACE